MLVMVTNDDFPTAQPPVFFGILLLFLTALRVILSYFTLKAPPVTSWNTLGAFFKWRFCSWMLVKLLT